MDNILNTSATSLGESKEDFDYHKNAEGRFLCTIHGEQLNQKKCDSKELMCPICNSESLETITEQIETGTIVDHTLAHIKQQQDMINAAQQNIAELEKMLKSSDKYYEKDIQKIFFNSSQGLTTPFLKDEHEVEEMNQFAFVPTAIEEQIIGGVSEVLFMDFFGVEEKKIDSQIVTHANALHYLEEVIPGGLKGDLLYRFSKDGPGVDKFHECVDNKGPTLTIIKAKETQAVFGGFTDIPWQNTEGFNRVNGKRNTFMFKQQEDYKFHSVKLLDEQTNGFEVVHKKESGPHFLEALHCGADFEGNLGNGVTTISLFEFQQPDWLEENSNEAKFYLNNGVNGFLIQELEVFAIKSE